MEIVPVEKLDGDEYIVVSREEDFDMASNDIWDNDELKSYPHEGVVCNKCKKPVVISNFAYGEMTRNNNPEMVMCGRCFLEEFQKQ